MKKKIMCLAIIVAAICGFNVNAVYSEKENVSSESEKSVGETDGMNKEEIIMQLNNIFAYHPDMVSSIPGVTTTTNAEGIKSYVYGGLPLDAIDKDTLFVLLQSVKSQVSWSELVSGRADSPDYQQE